MGSEIGSSTAATKADMLAYAIGAFMHREGLDEINLTEIDLSKFSFTGKQTFFAAHEGKIVIWITRSGVSPKKK